MIRNNFNKIQILHGHCVAFTVGAISSHEGYYASYHKGKASVVWKGFCEAKRHVDNVLLNGKMALGRIYAVKLPNGWGEDVRQKPSKPNSGFLLRKAHLVGPVSNKGVLMLERLGKMLAYRLNYSDEAFDDSLRRSQSHSYCVAASEDEVTLRAGDDEIKVEKNPGGWEVAG